MSVGVTPVINMSNDMSALTNIVSDTSGRFDDESLDSSGCFDSAADLKKLCLDHGCDIHNDSVC